MTPDLYYPPGEGSSGGWASQGMGRPPAPPPPPPPVGPSLFIRPAVHGTGDGSSWDNAGSFSNLAAFVTALSGLPDQNRTVFIAAWDGDYSVGSGTTQTLTAGGSASNQLVIDSPGTIESCSLAVPPVPWQRVNPSLNWNPVNIRGANVDLTPAHAVLVGGRQVGDPIPSRWVMPVNDMQHTQINVNGKITGSSCIRLAAGANNLRFRHLHFKHFGEPGAVAINSGVSVVNIEFDNLKWFDCRRFYETVGGSTATAGINGFWFHDCEAIGCSKFGVRTSGTHQHGLIENFYVDSRRQNGDEFAECFNCDQTAHDIAYVDCEGHRAHDSEGTSGALWQGDCFATERDNNNIQHLRCIATWGTHSGFDTKATNGWMIDCTIDNCRESSRHRSSSRLVRCVVSNPVKINVNGFISAGGICYFMGANVSEGFEPIDDIRLIDCNVGSGGAFTHVFVSNWSNMTVDGPWPGMTTFVETGGDLTIIP